MHLYRGNCKRWAKFGGGVRGCDPLLQNYVPVGGKLLPDIAEADRLFGDKIPSYKTVPVGEKLLPDITKDDTLFGDVIPSYKTMYL
jgi:hypothetical protein